MDELSEQLRAYYGATTEPTRVGQLAVEGAADRWASASITSSIKDEERTGAAFEIQLLPRMEIDDLEVVMARSKRETSRRRKWMMVVAAVAVPTLVVGGLVAASRDNDTEPAVDNGAVPVSRSGGSVDEVLLTDDELARRFLESYGALHPGVALPYVADDAYIAEMIGIAGNRPTLASFTAWLRAVGYRQTLTDCEEHLESPVRSQIRCSFEFGLLHSDHMGLGPFTGSFFEVVIEDQEIVSASVQWDLRNFLPEVWEPFAVWVATEYPGDAAIMYTDDTLSDAEYTEDSIRLWKKQTREYASLQTEVDPVSADYRLGRHSMAVDGVPFSFEVTAPGWETYEGFLISKSTHGPQGAEAVIFFAAYPDGEKADPCGDSLWPPPPSIGGIAAAAVDTPGVELVSGPTAVMVGGRNAMHVAFTVQEDVGCDPGFFYNWKAQNWGALWVSSQLGDTIDIWIVDVDGTILFIGGETHPDEFSGGVVDEIQLIVASIRFE